MKVERFDWLLIVGIILAPMTYLRIGKLGPGELFCFLWSIKSIKGVLKLDFHHYLKKFWIFFIFSIILGTLYGLMFYPNELYYVDVVSYFFFAFLSISIFVKLSKKDSEYVWLILKNIAQYGTIWYGLLLLYSTYINRTFMGIPLWYENSRFTGGALNPHQLAILMGAIFFTLIRSFVYSNRLKDKFLFVFLILICYIISSATKSSTLVLSIFLTFFVLLFFTFTGNMSKKARLCFSGALLCIIFCIFLVFYNYIYEYIYDWIAQDANGLGRFDIFKTVTYIFEKNPIIGLGPGSHAYNGTFEFHNTYLEIFAMSGIVGFTIFLSFSIKLFKKVSIDPFLVLPLIIFYIYGFAGFAFRRIVYWGITGLIISLADKDSCFVRGDENER